MAEYVGACGEAGGSGMVGANRILYMKYFLSLLMVFVVGVVAKDAPELDPEKGGRDFQVQGEYTGEKLGVQVIALGEGKFRAVILQGGLPGAGWDKTEKVELDGALAGDKVEFAAAKGWKAVIDGGKLSATSATGASVVCAKEQRKSPTLGEMPPAGAVVLFDGTSADHFKPGKKTEDGLLMQGANSVRRFQSQKLHIEFQLPFQPKARGQGRGNSGCYLQGRFEVQVLDSFGLAGKDNECGGLYSIKSPDLNMCLPPLTWQTYDVDFTAAKFDGDGKKIASARMTVLHNGVKIHDNVELPKTTTAAPLGEGAAPGYLHLQDHGQPVRYRNIWVVEK